MKLFYLTTNPWQLGYSLLQYPQRQQHGNNMKDKTFILVEVSDNEPARALVENLMDEMGGKVVDMVTAVDGVVAALGTPTIKWSDDDNA